MAPKLSYQSWFDGFFNEKKKVNNRKWEDIYHVLEKSKSLYDSKFMIYLFSNPFQHIKSKIFVKLENYVVLGGAWRGGQGVGEGGYWIFSLS